MLNLWLFHVFNGDLYIVSHSTTYILGNAPGHTSNGFL